MPTTRSAPPQPKRVTDHAELLTMAINVNHNSEKAQKKLAPFFLNLLAEQAVEGEGRKLAHSVKSRVKPPEDIMGKIKRKRRRAKKGSPNWSYDPSHVTDGCGFRVVVLFQQDILLAVEQIIKMVKHEIPFRDNPIVPGGLIEAIIYTNSPQPNDVDGLPLQVREKLCKAGFATQTKPPENRKGGYSSVHFVVKVNIGGGNHGPVIPVEIQIRDIFEEAWCEIDHTLRYVNDREGEDTDIEEHWKRHLAVLKTAADGNSQHAALIKQTAIEFLKRRHATGQAPSQPIPSDSPTNLAERLAAEVPTSQKQKVIEAFKAMERARGTTDETVRATHFLEAAGAFGNVITELKANDSSKSTGDDRTVGYHLSMERAFCLQSTTDKQKQDEAIGIYQTIMEQWPNDAFATYRLAYLLRRRGDVARAEEIYRKGYELLASDTTIPAKSWLHAAMPRQLGFVLWGKTNERRGTKVDDEHRATLLEEAVHFTRLALKAAVQSDLGPAEEEKCINNLLYYLIKREELRTSPDRDTMTEITELVGRLRTMFPQTGVLTPHLLAMHTVMVAYTLLEDGTARRNIASDVGRGLFEMACARARRELQVHEVRSHLPESFHDVYDDVAAVLLGWPNPNINGRKGGHSS